MPIFDQGYQHWSGELSGHSWRWLAIARHGVRVGMKSSILRLMLLFAWLPAIGLAFAMSLWGLVEQKSPLIQALLSYLQFLGPEILSDPKSYRVEVWTLCYSYFLLTELRFSMILILIVGPSLISQDIRFNALPLYFSRPLRRIDYFLGKLGVIGYFLGMVLVVPSIVAYVLGLLFSMDMSILKDTFPLLLASVAYGLVVTLSAGLLMLALSSLSRNSRYIGLFWIGVWFITSITGNILELINREQRQHEYYEKMVAEQMPTKSTNKKLTPQEQKQQNEERNKLFNQLKQKEFEDARSDWRPLVSYTSNLIRVGDALLGTDKCWERLSLDKPAEARSQYLINNMAPMHPWQWSAFVLLVLFGISVCILNFRVRSLDRLR
ncbi:MAG TPA: ABC transporter permease subunit [Gemmata sp.]|jgi:ABC-2 type transport system permease protein|nr:ABC transporter permease subunit [Gemmata sp.]